MCGILGLVNYGKMSYPKARAFRKAARGLLRESQRRGSSASGICVLTNEEAAIYKSNLPASRLVGESEFSNVAKKISHTREFKSFIGHTRAPTQGSPLFNVNNHPIVVNRIIGVHNGQISNDFVLFGQYKESLKRKGEVDSEIIFSLIDHYRSKGETLIDSVKKVNKQLLGSYTCAFIDVKNPRYLCLFNSKAHGDLSLLVFSNISTIVFASEYRILKAALEDNGGLDVRFATREITIKSSGMRIDVETGEMVTFDLESPTINRAHQSTQHLHACSAAGVWYGCNGHCEECDYAYEW